MIHLPTIDLISLSKPNENEKNEPSLDFKRFKLNNMTKMNRSLQIKLNIVNKESNAKSQVAFGSSQERRRPSGKKIPPLQYNLNFKSVDRHQASPKLRTIRSTRIKSEVSQQFCERFPYSILKTETIEQTIQPTKLNCLQKLIKKVKTPIIELKSNIILKQDEFIPMSSKELKQSLVSLMQRIQIFQAEVWYKIE